MNAEKETIQNDVDEAEIPEYVFKSLARSLLPVIRKYYESEEENKRHIFCITQPGGLPSMAALPAFSLPVFNFLDINNKSEPMTYWKKVRIILIWWRRRLMRHYHGKGEIHRLIKMGAVPVTAPISNNSYQRFWSCRCWPGAWPCFCFCVNGWQWPREPWHFHGRPRLRFPLH